MVVDSEVALFYWPSLIAEALAMNQRAEQPPTLMLPYITDEYVEMPEIRETVPHHPNSYTCV